MSLNKTLDRLFDEIRREAKRNSDFADRLDAVLRLHDSRRDVPDEVIEDVALPAGAAPQPHVKPAKKKPPSEPPAVQEAPSLNPAGLYKREGEAALEVALAELDEGALKALIREHNLDPAGSTEAMDREALAAHILAQAKRRAERDDKMFDY